ncbi:MAG: hypothetical protein M3680_37065 [Myxococcota bacterium]|nr:hypothetical protein [Myxococcota bacterium]
MRSTLVASLFALPLLASCTDRPPVEEFPLDEVIDDAKQDGFHVPTRFGTLFANTWQYGLLDPSTKLRTPAWTFTLGDAASVTLQTRQAPTDDVWVTDTVVYLYSQRTDGTWRRIAKSTVGGFGTLSRDLTAGAYRVIVKGLAAADEGEFMVRLGCTGPGCQPDSCLFGDSFYELRQPTRGALTTYKQGELTIGSPLSATEQAQIIAAVQVSAVGEDVTTLAEAFAAVDGQEINHFAIYDSLAGRSFLAFEYGAGDSSYGALFQRDEPARVAEIGDGEIRACTVAARSCVLGRTYHEAAFMPDLRVLSTRTITQANQVNVAFLKDQIVRAVNQSSHQVTTLAEAFAAVDQGELFLRRYRHTDGREFVSIEYGAGDNSYGAFFDANSANLVAAINDGDLYRCTAW